MTESLSKFYQLKDDVQQAFLFCDQVMAALGNPDNAIAKIKELSEQSQLLSEIGDILRMANTECLDHYRSKQEEKIVLTGFRGLCDIHLALFKKRSEYEIYGSRIIDDLLNSEDPQAQKQAYDQEEIQRRIDKAERESFDSLREFYFALAEMLGVNNDKEMIAKIKELAEIKAEIALGNIGVLSNLSYEFRSQIKQALYKGAKKDKYPSIDEFPDDDAISFVEHLIDRHKHWGRDHEFTQFALEVKQLLIDSVGKDISNEEAITEIKRLQANDSATYDPFQDKYKLENIEHAISFRATVASYLGCSYDRNEAIAKIEQIKRATTYTLEQQNLETFWRKIRVLFGNTEMSFESAYNRIVDLLHNPERFTGDKDREIEKLQAFQSQVMKMLGLDITFREENISITNEDAYMVLQNLLDRWEEFKKLKNESVKDREIKRLNGDISGIASFLNLPSDAKQPDICFAIMELKQEKKKYYKGYFQLEVISKYLKLPENCKPMDITTEVIELKEELDQAKKVIARLVGE